MLDRIFALRELCGHTHGSFLYAPEKGPYKFRIGQENVLKHAIEEMSEKTIKRRKGKVLTDGRD